MKFSRDFQSAAKRALVFIATLNFNYRIPLAASLQNFNRSLLPLAIHKNGQNPGRVYGRGVGGEEEIEKRKIEEEEGRKGKRNRSARFDRRYRIIPARMHTLPCFSFDFARGITPRGRCLKRHVASMRVYIMQIFRVSISTRCEKDKTSA